MSGGPRVPIPGGMAKAVAVSRAQEWPWPRPLSNPYGIKWPEPGQPERLQEHFDDGCLWLPESIQTEPDESPGYLLLWMMLAFVFGAISGGAVVAVVR